MGTSSLAAESSNGEVFNWLKTIPVAPEYHPTLQEFLDPISYIFKIEKDASKFGICKIVPPLPPQPKRTVITHFNKSISLLNKGANNDGMGPTFTTRQQQIGFCPRKQRPIQKSVWQSGENYTLQEFEAKAKSFEKSYLKDRGKKGISPLEVETLYWKANGDRPFSVEYANDMPGSAFVPLKSGEGGGSGSRSNVGDSAWNMRGVARAKGSLLRFMKEEIPGVTSPMVYIAMLFSWFAWHVEDHDLHSLNYLHFGAPKTWYGVPRDAAVAFEEVIRVHGFGEEINPLVTFATLGEKTTVMSPEVLMNAGVPCCRLVQNAGEFVVTFPRAYHSGFSHGFNCGEASNIATPEWLRFAKDAAIRRASINYPPMVSHFQLLYDLVLAICLRVPMGSNSEPRSSRLKDKKKGEGEISVKQMFVEDMMQHNELLYSLGQGAEVVLLPPDSSEKFAWSNLHVCSKYKMKSGLPFNLYSSEESIKDDIMLARDVKQHKAFYSVKAKFNSMNHETQDSETEKRGDAAGDGLSDRGLFSCVKCGIWTFACVAIVQPTESAAQYLKSADCSSFSNWFAGFGTSNHEVDARVGNANPMDPDSFSASMKKIPHNGLYSVDCQAQSPDNYLQPKSNIAETVKVASADETNIVSSALGLLALTYGNSSDSDEDDAMPNRTDLSEDIIFVDGSCDATFQQDATASPNAEQGYDSCIDKVTAHVSSKSECEDEVSLRRFKCDAHSGHKRAANGNSEDETHGCSANFTEDDTMTSEHNYCPSFEEKDAENFSSGYELVDKSTLPSIHRCDEDSSRLHVFCLEHAAEVEKHFRPIGGVHILLLCHPDYPNAQTEAMKVAEEFDIEYVWKDITFSEATKEDEERIQLALISEEATPKNRDWAVKLGINLFYSAILSRSPLYNKQMPYNSVIYDAFGCSSASKSSPEDKIRGKGYGRQRKVVVAGKWCGKVWMSNQVHPLLLQTDVLEEERASQFCLPSKDKIWGKSEISKAQTTSTNRKLRSKRKWTAKVRVAKKMKFEAMASADTDLEESEGNMVSVPQRSIKKSKKRGGQIKRVKHQEECADTDIEESEGDMPVSVTRRSIRKSKTPSGPIKRVKHREVEFPDSASEESSDDEPHQGPWSARALKPGGKRVPKPKHQQSIASNESSDESLDDRSDNLILRSCNSKMRIEGKPKGQVKGRPKEIVDSESEGSISDKSLQGYRTFSSPQLEPNVSRKRVSEQFELVSEDEVVGGPRTRLRKRISKPTVRALETKLAVKKQAQTTKGKKAPVAKSLPARKGPKMRLPAVRAPAMKGPARKAPTVSSDTNPEDEEPEYRCNLDGCTMVFESNHELALHKQNVCPVKGCGKNFFSHKYLVQHRRVHMDDRPLKCPWKGCKMTFKWAWARTEHIRVHTGARPYVCTEPGCGQTFRFVSDFSRHKRKTGHSPKKIRK